MGIRSFLPALLVILLCAGCAATSGSAGPTSGAAEFARVVPGKSTKDEVRAAFGTPARAHQYRAEAGETWEYPYFDAYQDTRIFWVEFRTDGTVSKTDDTKDFYAYPYRGR